MVSQAQNTLTANSIPAPSPVTYQTSLTPGTTVVSTLETVRSK